MAALLQHKILIRNEQRLILKKRGFPEGSKEQS
jgi:hypothetical protein